MGTLERQPEEHFVEFEGNLIPSKYLNVARGGRKWLRGDEQKFLADLKAGKYKRKEAEVTRKGGHQGISHLGRGSKPEQPLGSIFDAWFSGTPSTLKKAPKEKRKPHVAPNPQRVELARETLIDKDGKETMDIRKDIFGVDIHSPIPLSGRVEYIQQELAKMRLLIGRVDKQFGRQVYDSLNRIFNSKLRKKETTLEQHAYLDSLKVKFEAKGITTVRKVFEGKGLEDTDDLKELFSDEQVIESPVEVKDPVLTSIENDSEIASSLEKYNLAYGKKLEGTKLFDVFQTLYPQFYQNAKVVLIDFLTSITDFKTDFEKISAKASIPVLNEHLNQELVKVYISIISKPGNGKITNYEKVKLHFDTIRNSEVVGTPPIINIKREVVDTTAVEVYEYDAQLLKSKPEIYSQVLTYIHQELGEDTINEITGLSKTQKGYSIQYLLGGDKKTIELNDEETVEAISILLPILKGTFDSQYIGESFQIQQKSTFLDAFLSSKKIQVGDTVREYGGFYLIFRQKKLIDIVIDSEQVEKINDYKNFVPKYTALSKEVLKKLATVLGVRQQDINELNIYTALSKRGWLDMNFKDISESKKGSEISTLGINQTIATALQITREDFIYVKDSLLHIMTTEGEVRQLTLKDIGEFIFKTEDVRLISDFAMMRVLGLKTQTDMRKTLFRIAVENRVLMRKLFLKENQLVLSYPVVKTLPENLKFVVMMAGVYETTPYLKVKNKLGQEEYYLNVQGRYVRQMTLSDKIAKGFITIITTTSTKVSEILGTSDGEQLPPADAQYLTLNYKTPLEIVTDTKEIAKILNEEDILSVLEYYRNNVGDVKKQTRTIEYIKKMYFETVKILGDAAISKFGEQFRKTVDIKINGNSVEGYMPQEFKDKLDVYFLLADKEYIVPYGTDKVYKVDHKKQQFVSKDGDIYVPNTTRLNIKTFTKITVPGGEFKFITEIEDKSRNEVISILEGFVNKKEKFSKLISENSLFETLRKTFYVGEKIDIPAGLKDIITAFTLFGDRGIINIDGVPCKRKGNQFVLLKDERVVISIGNNSVISHKFSDQELADIRLIPSVIKGNVRKKMARTTTGCAGAITDLLGEDRGFRRVGEGGAYDHFDCAVPPLRKYPQAKIERGGAPSITYQQIVEQMVLNNSSEAVIYTTTTGRNAKYGHVFLAKVEKDGKIWVRDPFYGINQELHNAIDAFASTGRFAKGVITIPGNSSLQS